MAPKTRDPFSYPKYWAECYGTAPFLPMSRQEMDDLGWDSCDIILVTGDAYVDHPSFGMAVMGRFLEAQGFRVGIISQPDWRSKEGFEVLGKPNLFFGVTSGNMDSMINRYTADLRMRHDDAYTAGGMGGKRPDRAVTVYSQRCKEAFKEVPIVIGGIEASLRRIAQYDHWSSEVRRSVLIDATADILLYGNAERAIAELAHRLAAGVPIDNLVNIRGTVVVRKELPSGWTEIDSSRIDWPGHIDKISNPYDYHTGDPETCASMEGNGDNAVTEIDPNEEQAIRIIPMPLARKEKTNPKKTYIRVPSFDKVRNDPVLYAHTSRVLHQEANPYNARVLVQRHGNRELWVNPPPIPLETSEIDGVFDLEYQRRPHPSYGDLKIPAYDMIKTSVNIMRGCFGGCTFCSITEHEGRIIQSRSQESVLRELEDIRDKVPGFTGTISDLGGPTANMYHLTCIDQKTLSACRRLSCVYPTICKNLKTSHKQTTELYRKSRALPGIHKVMIASGLRYDLAIRDPEYVKELVTHHVGGYLKIAPEHTEKNTLSMMMKPEMGSYDEFKKMFDKYSAAAGKKQYLIPYFIAAHPGCDENDMMNLALWLKKNDFKVDQVQTFYPSPMSLATAMYHSGRNPLKKMTYKSKRVFSARDLDERRLQKAFLRYHDSAGWPQLRQSLLKMGRKDLIGSGDKCLVPEEGQEAKALHTAKARGKTNRGQVARGDKRRPLEEIKKDRAQTPRGKKPGDRRLADKKPGDRKPVLARKPTGPSGRKPKR